MPLKIKAFAHPEYDALRQRSQTLALWWGVAHGFFVIFSVMAVAVPLVLALMALIGSDVPKERLLSAGISSSIACLIISALGFCLRRYLSKKVGSF
jgi:predicted PurR-regulated permease PerM